MRASIKELGEKIKRISSTTPHELVYALIIVVLGCGAFGLGRLSALTEQQRPVTLMYNHNLSDTPRLRLGGTVVASWKGSKYHYPWCPGALQMSEGNKRWFDSPEDARAAGYAPASNCKGLE